MKHVGGKLMIVMTLVGVVIFILAVIAGVVTARKSHGREVEASSRMRVDVARMAVEVVDGDTIKVNGRSYRLMGFDTPETFQAKCGSEKALGITATNALAMLIGDARVVELELHGLDKYKRRLAVLYVDNEDVAGKMITAGYAVPYNGRTKRRSWCNDTQ